MSNSFLSQEEIDALLKGSLVNEDAPQEKDNPINTLAEMQVDNFLTDIEKDTLGEIGNISMGSAATALSQLLNKKVNITTPIVGLERSKDFLSKFSVPYIFIEVDYTEGIQGSTLLIIKTYDAAIIADLMMGGNGKNPSEDINEIALSAVGEAMNQMIGSSATSLSQIFSKPVVISPPRVKKIVLAEEQMEAPFDAEYLCVTSFAMEIGDLIKSEIMQVLPVEVAKEEARLLLGPSSIQEPQQSPENTVAFAVDSHQHQVPEPVHQPIADQQHTQPSQTIVVPPPQRLANETHKEIKNIDLILDVPLQVSVLLGKTRKPLKEVLALYPGSIVELEKLADEPVDILVNGTLIAKGEVVVIGENFGIKITNIISPMERINYLR